MMLTTLLVEDEISGNQLVDHMFVDNKVYIRQEPNTRAQLPTIFNLFDLFLFVGERIEAHEL